MDEFNGAASETALNCLNTKVDANMSLVWSALKVSENRVADLQTQVTKMRVELEQLTDLCVKMASIIQSNVTRVDEELTVIAGAFEALKPECFRNV